MKEGYKQTEIGVIPEDWEVKPLKDVVVGNLKYGVNAPAIPYLPPLPNYIRITDISEDGRFLKADRASVDCTNPDLYLLNNTDICFARTGASTGKTYLYRPEDGSLVYAGFLIKASISPELADSVFIFHVLHTQRYWDWVSVTSMRSGQPGINGVEYSTFNIQYPGLSEQHHIAEALSDMDELIASLEKLIAKKKAIKQGAMQELLTGKRRLPGFSGEWREVSIGEWGYLTKECVNPQLYPTEFFWEYSMPAYDEDEKPVKQVGKNMHSNRTRIKGTVLLFNKLNVRQKRIWYVENCGSNAVCSSEFLAYCSEKIDLRLVKHILGTDNATSDFVGMSTGTSNSQKRITPNCFLEYKINIPIELNEQNAIADILENMDKECSVLEDKLEKTRQIKQGMMQQLLTGKIRLV